MKVLKGNFESTKKRIKNIFFPRLHQKVSVGAVSRKVEEKINIFFRKIYSGFLSENFSTEVAFCWSASLRPRLRDLELE